MIKYSLNCKKCDLNFESWFANSREYEKLKRKKLLKCLNCDSLKIEKSLMAPRINKKEYINRDKEQKKIIKIKKKINEYQKFIKNNFEYVGENFTHEARLIHYDNKKKEKNIYGTATKHDLKELSEEGIDVQMIPWIKDSSN